jgi:hypothetical protein
MLTAIAMGLLISTVADSQFVAGQMAIVVTFLPAFILSGFIFDIGSMPMLSRELPVLFRPATLWRFYSRCSWQVISGRFLFSTRCC